MPKNPVVDDLLSQRETREKQLEPERCRPGRARPDRVRHGRSAHLQLAAWQYVEVVLAPALLMIPGRNYGYWT
jgi:hypothetical protein